MVDRRCRESEGKVKIEGYMSISDEEAHHRLQVLTLTKAHKECAGPLKGVANSMIKYGHPSLLCVWLDDPVKVISSRL